MLVAKASAFDAKYSGLLTMRDEYADSADWINVRYSVEYMLSTSIRGSRTLLSAVAIEVGRGPLIQMAEISTVQSKVIADLHRRPPSSICLLTSARSPCCDPQNTGLTKHQNYEKHGSKEYLCFLDRHTGHVSKTIKQTKLLARRETIAGRAAALTSKRPTLRFRNLHRSY